MWTCDESKVKKCNIKRNGGNICKKRRGESPVKRLGSIIERDVEIKGLLQKMVKTLIAE